MVKRVEIFEYNNTHIYIHNYQINALNSLKMNTG